jgi:hypothetical protein
MAAIFSALSVINDLLSTAINVDIIGIYDEELQPLFIDVQYLQGEVKESSQVMRHPVETGTMIADNHIINQVEINLSLMIMSSFYNSMYSQLKQAFVEGRSLTVQTRTSVYHNMIIADMPHQENADIFDGVVMHLHLMEVLYVVPTSVSAQAAPANFSPEDPVNSNTVQAGLKSPQALSTTNIATVNSSLTSITNQE